MSRRLKAALGLALAARGVDVTGIELSEAMVEQLRAKPGGDAIPVTIGDMATTRVDGRFGLVYLVFNTLVNKTPTAIALSLNIQDYWLSFATSLTPNDGRGARRKCIAIIPGDAPFMRN